MNRAYPGVFIARAVVAGALRRIPDARLDNADRG